MGGWAGESEKLFPDEKARRVLPLSLFSSGALRSRWVLGEAQRPSGGHSGSRPRDWPCRPGAWPRVLDALGSWS